MGLIISKIIGDKPICVKGNFHTYVLSCYNLSILDENKQPQDCFIGKLMLCSIYYRLIKQ